MIVQDLQYLVYVFVLYMKVLMSMSYSIPFWNILNFLIYRFFLIICFQSMSLASIT